MIRALTLAAAVALPGLAQAQDRQTLADIMQELQVLSVELQGLQGELNTTSGPALNLQGTGALQRIDAMEAELRRLTSQTEELQNRINRVVSDGTNRIGDLRFRVCEVEPDCDFADLGETAPLGGVDAPAPRPAQPVTGGAQLAIGEQDDFDRARSALDAGNFRAAADQFAAFTETYTGGPLTGEAHLLRGDALAQLGDDGAAARAYLEAFSGQPTGPRAADALLALGRKLGDLGQTEDACVTLGEVPARFPSTPQATEAGTARAELGC